MEPEPLKIKIHALQNLSPAGTQHRSVEDKECAVAAQTGRIAGKSLIGKRKGEKFIQGFQGESGIGAASSETSPDRSLLLQEYLHRRQVEVLVQQ